MSWSLCSLRKGMTPWLAVGAFDVGAGAADRGPGAAEAAGPLGEEGVFGDAADHDGLDAVVHLVEVAGRELGVEVPLS
jgi:hypothetical protein